jgi:hypothetical protein
MKRQSARCNAGRLASSLFALCLASYGLIPEAQARENEESTQGEQQSSAAAEHTAEDDGPASANSASSQQADPHAHPVTKPSHKGGAAAPGADLASQATDPSAILTQMTNYFWTQSTKDDRGIANQYVLQPVLPLSGSNVLRPTIPVISHGGMDGVTGLGDMTVLDFKIFHLSSGSFGVGPALTLPTATSDELGAGKWSAGPALFYLFKGIPKTILGVLIYNEWAFAGDSDREKVNQFVFQNVWTTNFSWGYIGWTDQLGFINWEQDNLMNFPIGVRIGKVWMDKKTPINVAVQPYYTIRNKGQENTWGIKFQATLILPGALRH